MNTPRFKRSLFFLFLLCTAVFLGSISTAGAATAVFINEIHYDNASTDSGEAIEIAGPAGTDLSGWDVVFYNGNSGASYATLNLSGIIPDQQGGFGTLDFSQSGIQNGAPDGLALVNGSTVVQFLSYEGTFVASDGPASGMSSTDIGVAESSGTAVGDSLQLTGSGTMDTDFTWASEAANTFGAVNTGQTFAGGPPADPVLVINEIDYDQPGTDFAEFVEIKNVGTVSADLSEFTLELVNGSGGGAAVYQSYALPSVTLAIGDYFVVCGDAANVANCDLDVSPNSNLVQNGAPDGAGLLYNGTLVDAVSYEGDTAAPYTEGSGTGLVDSSSADNAGISRFPDGADTDQNNVDLSFRCITPGKANVAESSNCVLPSTDLVINEIDYDQPSSDTAEFVEIRNNGDTPADLGDWALQFVNGSNGAVYDTINLPAVSLAAGDYYVVCANTATVANCDLDDSPDTNFIQNGSPDGVALLLDGTIIDTVSYEGDLASPYTEGSGNGLADSGSEDGSISRCADGVDTDQNNVDFIFISTSTPGEANVCVNITDIAVTVRPPTDFNGWDFGVETGSGSVDFVAGPDTAPLGNGSAEFNLADATSGVVLGTQAFTGVPLDSIKDLQYSTYNSVGNNLVAPALQINIDYDLNDSSTNWQGRLVFEPYFDNTVVDGTWQTWNPMNGRWWSSGTPIVGNASQAQSCPQSSPCTWATILATYPDAGVQTGAASGVLFKAGSGWLAGYQGNVDAFVIQVDDTRTTFDFEPEIPPTLIHDIQGNGFTSPLVGQEVLIEGIVVGDFQAIGQFGGFHVQEEDLDADADVATSEGIFVFNYSNDVNVGDKVRVTGTVQENYGLTRLTSISDVTILSSGNPAPTAATISLPVTSTGDFEAYEGMLVTLPQNLVITEFFNFDRYGEIVLSTDRQFQPTAIFEPGSSDAAALATSNQLSRITLDDGRSGSNPDPARHPNGATFDLTNTFRGGDTVQDVVGVMDYAFGSYKIQPTAGATYTSQNPRTAPPAVGGDIKVASFNVLNYFTTIDTDPNDNGPYICGPLQDQGCRGANDADELNRQRDKIVAALLDIDADVVGLIEIENHATDAALQDIVASLNNVAGAGTYDYIATGPVGSDVIKVALIYQPATVTPSGAYAVLDDPSFTDPNGLGEEKNRAALAQTFTDNATTGAFTVVVNHLKSKGSGCGLGDDDPEQGSCNLTRTLAAQALVDWLATDPTNSGDPDVLIIGDLNAYDKEDPIDAVLAGPDDTANTGDDYSDLLNLFGGEYAYSYVFSGQFGYLDYGLANANLLTQVAGATAWNANSDEPDILDYDTTYKKDAQDALYEPNAYRASDHDPVIVGLNLSPYILNSDGCIVLALEGSPFDGFATVVETKNGRFNALSWKHKQHLPIDTCFEIHGTDGNDRIYGAYADDTIFGYDGNDKLYGKDGNDILIGGDGNDYLNGNAGFHDELYGEAGNDNLVDHDGVAAAHGGRGNDRIRVSLWAIWVSPSGAAAVDGLISGGYGNDNVGLVINDYSQEYFVKITGDEYDDPPSSEEGHDVLMLRGRITSDSEIVKFETVRLR